MMLRNLPKETLWHAEIKREDARTLDVFTSWSDDGPMRKLILLLLAGCTACSTGATPQAIRSATPATPQSVQVPQGGQGDTMARIRALAGTPTCSDDGQCHTLALGARACGGPESYLPWSSARTPQAEI